MAYDKKGPREVTCEGALGWRHVPYRLTDLYMVVEQALQVVVGTHPAQLVGGPVGSAALRHAVAWAYRMREFPRIRAMDMASSRRRRRMGARRRSAVSFLAALDSSCLSA